MIVKFVTFAVDESDRAAFDVFMSEFADSVKPVSGCLIYETLTVNRGGRGALFAAWADEDSLSKHQVDPEHLDMLATASERWGLRDLHVYTWPEAGDPLVTTISGAAQLASSRRIH